MAESSLDYQQLADLVARGLAAAGWRADCCIAATALSLAVAARRGLRGRALVVDVLAFNQPARALLDRGKTYRGNEGLWQLYGAWSVGIGCGAPAGPGRWPHHLVALLESGWLVDPALGQAARPGLELSPLALPAGPLLRGESELVALAGYGPAETLVLYRPTAPTVDFRASPDWRGRDRWGRLVGPIAARLEQAGKVAGG